MRRRRILRVHLINSPDIAAYAVSPADLDARLREVLGETACEIVVTENHSYSDVTPEMQKANVIVCYRFPTAEISRLPNLRWIHLISAGVDHLLPLDWLPRRVMMTNNSGVHVELAGEYACAALLMLNIGIPGHVTQQRLGGWDRKYNSPIKGKSVLVIGVGAIGGSAAMHAKRMGMRVLGVRRSRRPHRYVDEMYAPEALERLLPKVDFVLIAAALTTETRGLMGARQLDLMRREAGLVNMARAAVIDQDALAVRLNQGRLRGAVIDVCNPEPLPADSALRGVRNLVITPHISSDPSDYPARTIGVIADNAIRFMRGGALKNRVHPERGY